MEPEFEIALLRHDADESDMPYIGEFIGE